MIFGFAMKLGWKIHKHNENVGEIYYNKIGVKFQVFKLWMHKNKHNLEKSPRKKIKAQRVAVGKTV
jgi:ZF-HD class homeobox domain-containing protein